ncbi:MAG: isoprenylcysteine carboxylmethyltransferase family protein [Acidobacteriia bacterium]|nr:isoprenylcysteine carboxylmethyltransferase family protein [Terriglobia bacterium]
MFQAGDHPLRFDWTLAPFYAVIFCWCAFAAIFLFRKRPPALPESVRDRRALWPIALQALAYAAVWALHRHPASPLFTPAWTPFFGILAVLLAASSVGLVLVSVRTLGGQWAIAARLIEGHQLITAGPYRFVRNPIYTGMLGMLIATGLVAGHWLGLLLGCVLFLVGTIWRVRLEEQLLRARFGPQFEHYRAKVPALIPGVW